MTILLLLIIFVAYIGLGIPDSLLGVAWPAIYPDLKLPVSYASIITTIIYSGTIISSFMSSRVIKKLRTSGVAFLSTLLTALALLGFSYSKSIVWFCLLAFPLGIGAGSIDTALNNYVALNYKASHINFLHCFYGVGVTLSPYLMSIILSDNNNWRRGYKVMFAFQISIAVLLLVTLPIWKKVKSASAQAEENAKILTISQVLKIPKSKAAIGVYMGSCAIESMCLIWASTFIVDSRGLTPDKASGLVTFYFIGVTAGRFFSGVIANRLSSQKIIIIGQTITLCAIALLIFKLPIVAAYIGLFLVGLGNGPLFPNMTHLTPQLFGSEKSQSMIGVHMGFSYISIMSSPLIFGIIAQFAGSFIFPYYLLAMFAIMTISTIILFKKGNKKEG